MSAAITNNGGTAKTLNEAFHESATRMGDRVALRYKTGEKNDKLYHDISYHELADRVAKMAAGLATLGIVKGDRVALLSENRPEWAITDLAVLSLGAIVVPIYPTLPAPQIAYIVNNSGAKVLVVSDAKQLKKANAARPEMPELHQIVTMDAAGSVTEASDDVQTLAALLEKGAAHPLSDYEQRWRAVNGEDVASFVYTSGTTGDPKGAMLTHANFLTNVDAALAHFAAANATIGNSDVFMSFLPMCHVFERTTGYYLPLRAGATIAFSEGVFQLVGNMAEAQPTIMVCVPRVYESMQERIEEGIAKAEAKKRKLAQDAISVGRQVVEATQSGKGIGLVLGIRRFVYDKLVFGKMRERFGGKMRFFVSGGAALNAETARFFAAINMPIMEGYGLTESSPVIAVNPNTRPKIGTVGIPLPGVEVEIAEDGEILTRGSHVMKGYWKNDEATRQVIDAKGWLHTGDIGKLDEDGYLKITDRKKDILVLANGKNVAPQPIEQTLKQSPFISEIVLLGDKSPTVYALVLPNKEKLRIWAKEQNLPFADDDNLLISSREAQKKIKEEIDAHSKALADFEKVKRFTLLNTTFTVDGGEMTPTLKIKRKVVAQKYASEIAALRGLDSEASA